jgi:long-chain fatty acid transport protein
MKTWMRSLFIALLVIVWFQSAGFALTDEEVFSQFQFNFVTPGARANALGGAFIGLADDATAVESNPAGLTQLYDSEVSVEFKYIGYTAKQMYENYNGPKITRRNFEDSVEGIPFVSVVFPYKNFVFSIYRQKMVDYKSSFRTGQFPIAIPGYDWWTVGSLYSVDASADLTVTNYGIGFAMQLPFLEGSSLAVSPRWSKLEMASHSNRYDPDTTSITPIPTDFSDSQIVNTTKIDNNDAKFSINAGMMWRLQWLEEKLKIPRVSLGAVYRSGAKFELSEMFSNTFLIDFLKRAIASANPYEDLSDITKFTLKVPDSYGIGLAIQPMKALTFTLDVVRIEYKDLLEDFDLILTGYTTKDNFTVDNATEVHFGIEYTLEIGERLLALRAGVYNDPDHTVRFTGTTFGRLAGFQDAESWTQYYDTMNRSLFPGGKDQMHLTAGVGLVVNDRFQVDTAANIADKNKQFSISAVYRF